MSKNAAQAMSDAYHSEEKCSLVSLQRRLRVKRIVSMAALAQRRYHRRTTELLDKLQEDQRTCLMMRLQLFHLLERLVVDEAGSIFWYLQLPFLYVFPELPRKTC